MPTTPKKDAPDEIAAERAAIPLEKGMFDALFGNGRVAFFSTHELSALSQTCHGFRTTLKEEMTERALASLLKHVIRGEQEAAEKIIAANPSLLLVKSRVEDYSGRMIHGTAFQAALGADDQRMWKMMLRYFYVLEKENVIASAQETMRTQLDEQFPEDTNHRHTRLAILQHRYFVLLTAIAEDDDDRFRAMIDNFRREMTEKEEISSGLHFDLRHLSAACSVFNDNEALLDSDAKKAMFWIKVIGFVQRQLPANYAQELASHLVKPRAAIDPDAFARTLTFVNGGAFFPLRDNTGLGFNFAFNTQSTISGSTRSGYNAFNAQVLYYISERAMFEKEIAFVDFKKTLNEARPLEQPDLGAGPSHHSCRVPGV